MPARSRIVTTFPKKEGKFSSMASTLDSMKEKISTFALSSRFEMTTSGTKPSAISYYVGRELS